MSGGIVGSGSLATRRAAAIGTGAAAAVVAGIGAGVRTGAGAIGVAVESVVTLAGLIGRGGTATTGATLGVLQLGGLVPFCGFEREKSPLI